jgi:hypothetical protein
VHSVRWLLVCVAVVGLLLLQELLPRLEVVRYTDVGVCALVSELQVLLHVVQHLLDHAASNGAIVVHALVLDAQVCVEIHMLQSATSAHNH